MTPAGQVRRHLLDLAQETQLAHAANPDPFCDRWPDPNSLFIFDKKAKACVRKQTIPSQAHLNFTPRTNHEN